MLSILKPKSESSGANGSHTFLFRVVVSIAILAITLTVSAIWQNMVYTVPVLAVLL